MNRITMAVSKDEQNLILDMRAKDALNIQRKDYVWKLLQTTCEYNTWLLSTGQASSYINFIANFSYDEGDEQYPEKSFKVIEELLALAHSKAKEIIVEVDDES